MSFTVKSRNSLSGVVTSGSVDLLAQLLAMDSSPAFVNRFGDDGTPLCIAPSTENIEIAKLFLSAPGIRADFCTSRRETPLVIACRGPHLAIMNATVGFSGENIPRHSREVNQAFGIAFSFPIRSALPFGFGQGNFCTFGAMTIQSIMTFGQHQPLANPEGPVVADLPFELIPFFAPFAFLDVNYAYRWDSTLLAGGRGIASMPGNDDTALVLCASSGDFEWVKLSTDINVHNCAHLTAFARAVGNGHWDLLSISWGCPCPRMLRSPCIV
jgi:hypothetical protein